MPKTKTKTLFGFRNECFYSSSCEDVRYYLTRKSRDAALASLRDLAVSRGLDPVAARAGIYPVKRVIRDTTPGAEALIESASENEAALAAA